MKELHIAENLAIISDAARQFKVFTHGLYKPSKSEHRLIPPRHPQTNCMVERFNSRISEILHQTRFSSAAELKSMLRSYGAARY